MALLKKKTGQCFDSYDACKQTALCQFVIKWKLLLFLLNIKREAEAFL